MMKLRILPKRSMLKRQPVKLGVETSYSRFPHFVSHEMLKELKPQDIEKERERIIFFLFFSLDKEREP